MEQKENKEIQYRRYRNIFKKVLLCLTIFLFAYFYIQHNLKSNSVYYARYAPHGENIDTEMIMILENWSSIYIPTPNGYETSQFPDTDFVYRKYDKNGEEVEFLYDLLGEKIRYLYYNKNDGKKYEIDVSGKVTRIDDEKSGKVIYDYKYGVSYDPKEEKEIIEKARKFIKPILDANGEPLINLQWLFNMKYYNYFY